MDLCLLQNGDATSWRAFVDAYASTVLATLRRVFATYGRVASGEEQEDLSQEVFLKFSTKDFKLLKNFDPTKAKLATYVGVVARSTAIDYLRRQRKPAEDIADHADTIAATDSGLDGGGDPAKRRSNRAASTALGQLPAGLLTDKQMLILSLLFDHDLDPEDIAARLGVATQTIRSAKHKALTKIRSYLADLKEDERPI